MDNVYSSINTHKDGNKGIQCENTYPMSTQSVKKEIAVGKKTIRLTLEFPQQTEQTDTACFERTLKELYIGKLQNGSLQKSLSALTSSTLKREKEIGGLNHD